MDEHRCLEGIIDLALFDPLEKRWSILDWKTNRIERGRDRQSCKRNLSAADGSILAGDR